MFEINSAADFCGAAIGRRWAPRGRETPGFRRWPGAVCHAAIHAITAKLKIQTGLIVLLTLLAGCRSPYYADKGALLGGLTGAGVGAAIGDARDNAAGGALIGSAVGALAGAAAGSGLDAVQARNDALIQQQLGRRLTGSTTLEDVVAMSRAGLSDDVIIQQLNHHGASRGPTASDLIMLSQQGVSDAVMCALQDAANRPPPAIAPSPTPVYVEEHYLARPYPLVIHPQPCRPVWRGPYRYARHPRHGVSWGVSLSN